jgi:uncharacterized membrane protein
VWWIPASAALGMVALAVAIAPRGVQTTQASATLAQVQPIVAQRCAACHSATPTQAGFPTAPQGIMFDTPDEIVARAPQIYQQAVVTRNMPLGNLTNMTDAERDVIAAWVQAGAPSNP